MNALTLRKQLLLLEAEVRRDQLAADWGAIRTQLHLGRQQARKFGSFASTVVTGWAVLGLFRRGQRSSVRGRASLSGALIRGFKLASVLWPVWKAFQERTARRRR